MKTQVDRRIMEATVVFYNNKWRTIEERKTDKVSGEELLILKGGVKVYLDGSQNFHYKAGIEAEEALRDQDIIVQNYKKAYNGMKETWIRVPKYQHIERMGSVEVTGILEGTVYLQSKLDGANFTVFADPSETGPICASRNNIITEGFNGAVDYVNKHEGIKELTQEYILRGEWATPHTLKYPNETYEHFYVFDVQEYDTLKYLSPDEYEPRLEKLNIKYIHQLAKLQNPTLTDLIKHIEGPDEFGAKQKEGIVVKNFDYRNKYGRITWGKIVCAEFKERNKLTFKPTKKDPPELRFICENVTETLILKTIAKIKMEQGESHIKQMAQVLGRVWYDIFTEELWNFVKKDKTKEFNFREAQRLATMKTRNVALDYFNGIIQND